MNFYTADPHFGHGNILKHQPLTRVNAQGRPFRTIEDHDAYLIERWNAVVSDHDTVFCLGDFSFKLSTAETTLARLKGRKILIIGNHDAGFKSWVTTPPGWAKDGNPKRQQARTQLINAGFADVLPGHLLELNNKIVALAHFPYQTREPLPAYEARYAHLRPSADTSEFLLHGHIHAHWTLARYNDTPPMLNVGVDMHGLRPIAESEVIAFMQLPVAPATHPQDGITD